VAGEHISFAHRVSGFNRRRKWDLFLERFSPRPGDRVLDVGFSDLEHSRNDNFIEKNYPYPAMLTAIGVEEPHHFRERYPQVTAVQYDGTVMPFDTASFDICWSNAVLEHVGTHETRTKAQEQFLREIARVSKSAFVTTPNRWFPAEVHTRTPLLHWLPKRVFDRYLNMRGHEWATGDYMDLLSVQQLRSVLKSAGIAEYRIVFNRIAGFTLDFVVTFGERARPQSS
jgi:hypothetical protein